jgi:hypothetical protein
MSETKPRVIGKSSRYQYLLGFVRELEPGKAHICFKGKDFTCTPQSFSGVVRVAAQQRDMTVTVVTFHDRVVFAFYRRDSYMRPNLAAYPIVRKMRREF